MYSTNVKVESGVAPEAGIQEEVKLENVKFENNRLTFSLRQKNGALITHSEFEANSQYDVEVQQTDTSRRVKHIANAVGINLSIEETDSFEDYSNQVLDAFKEIPEGTYDVLFIYNKKGYVCLPKYPPFIQKTGTEPKLVISSYNKGKLIKPEPDPEPEPESKSESKKEDSLPF